MGDAEKLLEMLRNQHLEHAGKINELLEINTELKKIAARAINALDMFADQSRGKYADECRTVANELTKRYREITA